MSESLMYLFSTLSWWFCRHSLRPWLKRPLSEQSLETALAQSVAFVLGLSSRITYSAEKQASLMLK